MSSRKRRSKGAKTDAAHQGKHQGEKQTTHRTYLSRKGEGPFPSLIYMCGTFEEPPV
jgi:hypothetical protein